MDCEVIAHRGYSAIAPENTLSAFQNAIAHQADGIEFDVQLSADDELMVIHDSTLERTTNGQGTVRNSTANFLQQLDAGSWFHPQFVGETIPTLFEVLQLFKSSHLKLCIELKASSAWREENIQKILDFIQTPLWQHRCILISFDHDLLEKCRQYSATVQLGLTVKNRNDYLQSVTRAVQARASYLISEYHCLLAEPSLIRLAHEQQLQVMAWTVDQLSDFQQLQQFGIDGIMTNRLLPSSSGNQ